MKNKTFFFSILIFSSIYLLMFSFLPILFEDNDDVIMLLISSGYFTGTPDEHMVFMHVFIGIILKTLYKIAPYFEWYSFHLIMAQIVALSVISSVFWKKFDSKKMKIIFSGSIFIFSTFFILRLQFTTTAFLLAVSGYLFLHSLINSVFIKRNKQAYFWSIFLLLWSSMIRFDVFLVSSILVFPLFFKLSDLKFLLKIGSSILAITLLFLAFDKQYYKSDKDWMYYTQFNKIRSKIVENDNPNAPKVDLESIVSKSNLSAQNIRLLTRYHYPSENISNKSISLIYESIPKTSILSLDSRIWVKSVQYYFKEFCIFLFILGLLVLSKSKNWRLICVCMLFFAIYFGLSLNHVLKSRVFYGMFFLLTCFTLFLFDTCKKDKFSRFLPMFLCFCVCILFTLRFRYYINLNGQEKKQLEKNIICFRQNKVCFPTQYSFTFETLDPFSVSQKMKNNQILYFGWLTASPIYVKMLERSFNTKIQNHGLDIIDILVEN